MAPLLKLPPELLFDILSRLEQADQKQFRLTSRECEQFAAPIVFNEVLFDLDLGGCDGLTSIANTPSISRHVHTIRLQRRAGLKIFTDFEGWCKSNIHEYVPLDFEAEYEPTPINYTTQPMSLDEWKAIDHDDRRALYNQYESDLGKEEEYISRLASAASALPAPNSLDDREQIRNNPSDAQQILCAFTSAIKAFSNVHTLAYTPSYEYDDNWGRTWRNLGFHPGGLLSYSSHGIDPDIDALQLFIALRIIIVAPNALQSVELFTLGLAFWSVSHLRRLLDWTARLSSRGRSSEDLVDEGLESWEDDIGGVLAVIKHTEVMTRQLVTLERGFSRLTTLRCHVNTSWSERSDLTTIAKALSNMLQETVKLERLELIYRDDAFSDDHDTYALLDYDHKHQEQKRNLKELALVSKYLLHDSAPFLQHLRQLHLSLATGVPHLLCLFGHLRHLHHLQLDSVSLLPGGGQWETVLAWLAEHLHLISIKLRALEDICDQKQRLLLCPQSSEWSTNGPDNKCYIEYEDSIVRYALRQSSSVPTLSPTEFLHIRSQQHRPPSRMS